MVLLEVGAIAGIVTSLALIFGKKIKCDCEGNQLVLRDETGEIVGKIPIRVESYVYMEAFVDRATSGAGQNKIPNNPQITFSNPQDHEIRLLNISFIPTALMKTNGNLKVLVNGRKFLSIVAGKLADVETLGIPITENGLRLLPKPEGKIEIFIWNNDGISDVGITSSALVGEYLG